MTRARIVKMRELPRVKRDTAEIMILEIRFFLTLS